MAKPRDEFESDTEVRDRPKTRTPKQYQVVLLNDDFTSMEFVVTILETIFQKSPAEATQIMLQVHRQGRGVCGIFTKQIAEAKIEMVHQRAQSEGFPLRCILEEV